MLGQKCLKVENRQLEERPFLNDSYLCSIVRRAVIFFNGGCLKLIEERHYWYPFQRELLLSPVGGICVKLWVVREKSSCLFLE